MWGRTAHAEVLKRLARGDHPRSPKGKRPGVHEELDRICRRALAYDPDDRYPTALAFQEDLDAFISEHERRPSPRQLGTFVSNLFAEQQERAKGIIQDQLKELVSSRRTVVTIDVAVDSESSDTDQQPFSEDSIPRSHTPSALMQSQRPAPIDTKLSPTPGPPRTGRSSLVVLVAIAVVGAFRAGTRASARGAARATAASILPVASAAPALPSSAPSEAAAPAAVPEAAAPPPSAPSATASASASRPVARPAAPVAAPRKTDDLYLERK